MEAESWRLEFGSQPGRPTSQLGPVTPVLKPQTHPHTEIFFISRRGRRSRHRRRSSSRRTAPTPPLLLLVKVPLPPLLLPLPPLNRFIIFILLVTLYLFTQHVPGSTMCFCKACAEINLTLSKSMRSAQRCSFTEHARRSTISFTEHAQDSTIHFYLLFTEHAQGSIIPQSIRRAPLIAFCLEDKYLMSSDRSAQARKICPQVARWWPVGGPRWPVCSPLVA